MRRFRIGIRLTVVLAALTIWSLLGLLVGLWQLGTVRTQAENLSFVNQKVQSASYLHTDSLHLTNNLQGTLQSQDQRYFNQAVTADYKSLLQRLDQTLAILFQDTNETADDTLIGRELQAVRTDISGDWAAIVTSVEEENWAAAQQQVNGQLQSTINTIERLVTRIDAEATFEQQVALRNIRRSQQQTLIAFLITGILTAILAAFLGSRVAQRSRELQRQASQLETNVAMTERIISTLDLDKLLNEAIDLIKKRYSYDDVCIFLPNQAGTHLTLHDCTNQLETSEGGKKNKSQIDIDPDTLVGWVALNREGLYVNDVSQSQRFSAPEGQAQMKSKMALPMELGQKLLGVLHIECHQPDIFTEDDIPLLQGLANQVAIAIKNAKLYEGERSRRDLAETLYQTGRALTSTLDLTAVLELILKELAEIVPYDRAAIMLKTGSELEMLAARGFPEDVNVPQLRISIKENDVFQDICHTREPLLIPDVMDRPDWQHVEGMPTARAWLGFPLIRLDKVVGMISVTRETPNAYQEEDAAMVSAFSSQAAIVLENARLYDEITKFTYALGEKVEERTLALQDAYNQLERLDRTKSDFITIASHELRTPLTVIRGYSQLLLKDPLVQQSQYHRELVTSIHSGTLRLHEVVNSMLDMAKLDSRTLKLYPEPLSIAALIEEVCEQFKMATTERNLTLITKDVDRLPPIEADPSALEKVFYHLISNAIKFTPDGGKIILSGRPTEHINGNHIDYVEITVSDTGIGIEADLHQLVFTKFYQTGELGLHSTGQTKFKGSGPGLGLAIVRGIIEAHQGTIWIESAGHNEETLPGSHFRFRLPTRQKTKASSLPPPTESASVSA